MFVHTLITIVIKPIESLIKCCDAITSYLLFSIAYEKSGWTIANVDGYVPDVVEA